MPEVFLTGRPKHTEEAILLLESAFGPSTEGYQNAVMTCTDTSDYDGSPLKGQFINIDHYFIEKSLTPEGCDHIVLRPSFGLDIRIRTKPLFDRSTYHAVFHRAHIEHSGDFLTVTVPYDFYEKPSPPCWRKWCFFFYEPKEFEEES